MAPISYITTCKGRLEHLRQTLPTVAAQAGVECIVVDYGCPDGTAAWVAANLPQVRVVHLPQVDGFHLARARNLGAAAARGQWLAFFDADIAWLPTFAEHLLSRLVPGCYLRPSPLSPQTWGSVVCAREVFNDIGGYDEVFVGWGCEDQDLYIRLTRAGCREQAFDGRLLSELPHGDARRTAHYAIKDKTLQLRINSLYLDVKGHLARLALVELSADVRQKIYGEIEGAVLRADRDGLDEAVVRINLPTKWIDTPPVSGLSQRWPLHNTLVYRIGMKAIADDGPAPAAAA